MYLKVREFEKFQHYRDRRPPWIKLYRDLWSEVEFFALTAVERYCLISFFVVASQHDNRVPSDINWLKHELAIDVRREDIPLERIIERLVDEKWIEACDGTEKPIVADWPSRYVSPEQRARILDRDGHQCVTCGATEDLEIDHKIPVSKGGTSTDDNLQAMCRSCNRKKRQRSDTDPNASSAPNGAAVPPTSTPLPAAQAPAQNLSSCGADSPQLRSPCAESAQSLLHVCSGSGERETETETEIQKKNTEERGIHSPADTSANLSPPGSAPVETVTLGEFGWVRLTPLQHEKLKTRLNGRLSQYVDSFDRWVNEAPDAQTTSRGVLRRNRHAYETILNWADRDRKGAHGAHTANRSTDPRTPAPGIGRLQTRQYVPKQ